MTEYDFINIHFPTGPANIPGSLHLNVSPVGSTGKGVITSVIITVNAYSLDNSTPGTDAYIENVLQQIESINFTFDNEDYSLIITSRKYYPAQSPFYYYTVEPVNIPDYNDANQFVEQIKEVTLTPYLRDIQFGFSEFNPLISNASENRKSKKVQQSDRNEQTIRPANSSSLFTLTANPATIQDSLYSDTGWSNSRYEGSSTSALESAGIPPTLTGRTFFGEVFSSDSDTAYICALNNRLSQELFHTANTELPVAGLTQIELTLAQSFGSLQTLLRYSTITDSGSIDVGDVLFSSDGLVSGALTKEYVKVIEINTSNKTVRVLRDIYRNSTTNPTYIPADSFTKVERFDIFRFENTGQNRIQLVNNSRIFVEGNNTIIDTDDYGQIVSSSQCPYIGYIVTD
jgi:hypothetical protein